MRLAVTLAVYLLKLPLKTQDRIRLVGAILDVTHAIPLKEVMKFDQTGRLVSVRGRAPELEDSTRLREGALAMLDNGARKLVSEEVLALAGRRAVAEGDTPEKLYFYRAAIWWAQAENEFFTKLSQQ